MQRLFAWLSNSEFGFRSGGGGGGGGLVAFGCELEKRERAKWEEGENR